MTNDAGELTNVPITDTLEQRGNRYGSYESVAALSQTLQQTIYKAKLESSDPRLEPYMVESIAMICNKLSRIANGDAYYIDNWHDISGYSTLVSNILQSKES